MSVPFEIIECERCGYSASSLVTAGKFVWSDGGEEYWFRRKLAVCQDCECIVAMEEFPDSARLEEQERERKEKDEQRSREKGFLRRLFNPPLINPETFRDNSDSVAVARKVLALHRDPVCLSCGSSKVMPVLRADDGGSDNTRVRPLGVAHPGCGGMLNIYGSGLDREAPWEVTRIYDIQGRQIGERPGWR